MRLWKIRLVRYAPIIVKLAVIAIIVPFGPWYGHCGNDTGCTQ